MRLNNIFLLPKSLFIVIIVLLMGFQLQAQKADKQEGMVFFEGSWDEALAKATEEGKPIFVDAFTVWCGPCKRMAATTFPNPDVGAFYNKYYINYKLDMERGEGPAFAKKYGVNRYPTLLYIGADGKLLHRAIGLHQPAQFIAQGRKGLFDKNDFARMQKQYKQGERDFNFLREYVMMLAIADSPDFEEVANMFFGKLNPKDLQDTEVLQFTYEMANDIKGAAFDILSNNKEVFFKQYGQENVEKHIADVAMMQLQKASKRYDKDLFKKIKKTVKNSGYKKSNEYLKVANLEYYKATANWKKFAKAGVKYLAAYPTEDPSLLNNIAWDYYLHVDKKKMLKKAEQWAAQSVALNSKYYNNDTHAWLLYKLGDYKQAKQVAENAIELGKKERQKTQSTKRLLKKIEEATK